LGNDWSGEPAIFFMVILSKAQQRRNDADYKITQDWTLVQAGQPQANATV